MQTTDSVRSVKGVGEKAEQNLHKLKIETRTARALPKKLR